MLAALAVLALALPVQAQTQTPVQLVSTIEQTNVGSAHGPFDQFDAAQAFTTGTDTNGYKLTSVGLRLYVIAGTSGWVYSVSVWSATATGSPDTSLGTLTTPALATGTTAFGTYTFTESGNGIDLDPSTTYVIVVDVTTRGIGTNVVSISNTVSDDEDTVKATGWSIADGSLYRDWDSTGAWTTFDQTRRIRVNGYAKSGGTNAAPTAANNTVTAVADRAYVFSADDFGFADTDTGDTLASVKIVTLPTPGTLALDGTAVLADADVTKAQIDGNMLTFTPVAGASSTTGYASFTFKVNDGTVDSASTYTMTIDVTTGSVCAAPDFGTRRNIWTGTLTVGPTVVRGLTVAHGFQNAHSIGALSPTMFSIGMNAYTIDRVNVERIPIDADTAGSLLFSLSEDADLTTVEVAALRLHVCDTTYDFSDAGFKSFGTIYIWEGDHDWSTETTRTLYLSLPANNVATGEPAITGTAQVGQELTADASPIMDIDGLVDVDFTYQWIRVDADGTSNEEDISGEIAETYTLTDMDTDRRVKVKVSFIDDLGNGETRSATYPSTGTVTAACAAPDFGTRRNIWTGTLTVGPTVVRGLTVAHGFQNAHSIGALSPTMFSIGMNAYTIDRVNVERIPIDADTAGSLLFSLSEDADLTTVEVAALRLHVCDTTYDFSDAGFKSFGTIYIWEGDHDWSTETTRTLYLSLPANNPATGTPTITGTAQAGQELTADASPIMDTDGLTGVDLHLPVAPGGLGRHVQRGGHHRRDRRHLHPDQRRLGQEGQGQGELHRQPERRGDTHQRRLSVERDGHRRGRHQHPPDGGQQHGDDGRGHAVHLHGGRLRLRRHGHRRHAGEREDRDHPGAGHPGARRHGGPGGRCRHQGSDRRRHAHLQARPRCARRRLYDLHLQGERRHGRQRQRLHDDHRRDGRPRPRLHGAQLRRPARDLDRHGDGGGVLAVHRNCYWLRISRFHLQE